MNARPRSLAEVAALAESLERFGQLLREWLHEVRAFSTGREAAGSIARPPAILRDRFEGGAVADAWLAAYAEFLAWRAAVPPPEWAFGDERTLRRPWFSGVSTATRSRALVLRDTPGPFKRRNLFTPAVELRFALRPGRPRRTEEEKRAVNRERQRRFQHRRREEWLRLRQVAAAAPGGTG